MVRIERTITAARGHSGGKLLAAFAFPSSFFSAGETGH